MRRNQGMEIEKLEGAEEEEEEEEKKDLLYRRWRGGLCITLYVQ